MQEEYKELIRRIEKLEKDSHPPIGLREFDGFRELCRRIEKLENQNKKREGGSPYTSVYGEDEVK